MNQMPTKNIKEFIKDIKEFILNTPSEITDTMTEKYLTENFYQDDSIKEMVSAAIMFIIPFGEYYRKIDLPK